MGRIDRDEVFELVSGLSEPLVLGDGDHHSPGLAVGLNGYGFVLGGLDEIREVSAHF